MNIEKITTRTANYANLLCSIMLSNTLDLDALATSMDLEVDQVSELLDRAKAYQAAGAAGQPVDVDDCSVWEKDSVQFPRLIDEVMATQEFDILALVKAMDCSRIEVDALIDSAREDWDAIKESTLA